MKSILLIFWCALVSVAWGDTLRFGNEEWKIKPGSRVKVEREKNSLTLKYPEGAAYTLVAIPMDEQERMIQEVFDAHHFLSTVPKSDRNSVLVETKAAKRRVIFSGFYRLNRGEECLTVGAAILTKPGAKSGLLCYYHAVCKDKNYRAREEVVNKHLWALMDSVTLPK